MTAIEKMAREHDTLLAAYDALLAEMAHVAAGKVDPSRLRVDLLARQWSRESEPSAKELRQRLMEESVRVLPRNGERIHEMRPAADDALTMDALRQMAAEYESNGD